MAAMFLQCQAYEAAEKVCTLDAVLRTAKFLGKDGGPQKLSDVKLNVKEQFCHHVAKIIGMPLSLPRDTSFVSSSLPNEPAIEGYSSAFASFEDQVDGDRPVVLLLQNKLRSGVSPSDVAKWYDAMGKCHLAVELAAANIDFLCVLFASVAKSSIDLPPGCVLVDADACISLLSPFGASVLMHKIMERRDKPRRQS